MKKLGKDQDSLMYWEQLASNYADELLNEYHKHRLEVIWNLIPEELLSQGKNIFDFGCGDAIMLSPFLEVGAQVKGIDISPEMIAIAKKRLTNGGYDADLAQVGDVTDLKELETFSLDALFCFNVLAYLTDIEERVFYEEAGRIIKPGGYLVVTHSNQLFDMFSLNSYTLNFFKENLVKEEYQSHINDLFKKIDASETAKASYNVRENPLCYKHKLQKYGFSEIRQEYINLHDAPPGFLNVKGYPSTLIYSEEQKWKLMFTCSTFGSLSIRNEI